MDWDAGRTRQALRRIAALLCLFAALAERAAGFSCPVRHPVLWILRRAERVAREFVTGEAGGEGAIPAQDRGSAAEAARLALNFRALAAALDAEAAQPELSARRRPEPETRAIRQATRGPFRRVPAPDTS